MKRTNERVVQYTSLKGVDPQQTVDDFKARWVSHVKLGVHSDLVTLHLVKRGPGVPTPSEEAAAPSLEPLEPRHTLREAGIADGSSLLACIAGACDAQRRSAWRALACAAALTLAHAAARTRRGCGGARGG